MIAGGQQNQPSKEMMSELKGYLEVSKKQLQQLTVNTPPVTPKRKISEVEDEPLKGTV